MDGEKTKQNNYHYYILNIHNGIEAAIIDHSSSQSLSESVRVESHDRPNTNTARLKMAMQVHLIKIVITTIIIATK